MYHLESFQKLQSLVAANDSLKELLNLLPTNTRIRVVIENRIPTRLISTETGACLLAEDEPHPEWELVLESEALRLLLQSEPQSVIEWSKFLVQLILAGHLHLHPRISIQEWWNRGYPQIALRLAPELKSEISKLAFQSVIAANSAVEKFKQWVKRS